MVNVPELFGSMVFNQKVMKDRLPKETFKALKKTLDDGAFFLARYRNRLHGLLRVL